MPDPFDEELKALFDAVESPEDNASLNSPDCQELSAITQRYHKKELLGQGGIKKVWQTYDDCSKRQVAYAEPRDQLHPLFYDLLLEEAWLTASLQHPNIIKVHDVGTTEEQRPFFTMDLKQGLNLKEWRQSQNHDLLDIDQCLDIFITICEALEHAHKIGILHLDLKPDNIQIESFDQVVVCDWGLGRRLEASHTASTKEIAELAEATERSIGGTPGFMAPEQTVKDQPLGFHTDIYGLGALLHFILTGKRHVEGENASELIRATQSGHLQDLSTHATKLKESKALQKIIMTCLKLNSEERYRSVSDLIEDLRALRRFKPTSFQRQQPLVCAWLFYKRNQMLCNTSIGFTFFISLSLWWFGQQISQEVKLREQQEKRARVAEEQADTAQEEVARLLSEFLIEEQKGTASKIHQADQLNQITALMKARNMYTSPINTVHAMEGFSRMSLKLDPNSFMAWHQIAEAEFLRLNTAKTKSMLDYYTPEEPDLLKFYTQIPTLHYNEDHRPSLDELIALIETVEWTNHSHILIQRAILYDYHLRHPEERKMYSKVVRAYFLTSSKQNGDFSFHYNEKKHALTLKGTNQNPDLPTPRLITLQCLNIKKLILEGDFCPLLTGIKWANIETLDLSRHSPVTRTKNIRLNPHIRHVILNTKDYHKREIETLQKSINVIEAL